MVPISVRVKKPAWTSRPQLNVSWGIPTRNVFFMTEQLQQLRGEALSNEQHGNAPALTITHSPECVDEDVCSGMGDLVVIYGTD